MIIQRGALFLIGKVLSVWLIGGCGNPRSQHVQSDKNVNDYTCMIESLESEMKIWWGKEQYTTSDGTATFDFKGLMARLQKKPNFLFKSQYGKICSLIDVMSGSKEVEKYLIIYLKHPHTDINVYGMSETSLHLLCWLKPDSIEENWFREIVSKAKRNTLEKKDFIDKTALQTLAGIHNNHKEDKQNQDKIEAWKAILQEHYKCICI